MKTKSVLMVAKKSALAAAFCFYAVFLFADVSNEGTNLSDLLSMKNKINHIHDAGDRSLPYRMMPVSMSDVKQRLDQDVSKSLNEVSETWEYYANNLYTYDADGNMTIYLFQIWDDSTGQWQDHEKNISNYDDQNHLLNETIHIWEEDAWLANYGVSYTYDMNDNVIESRTYYASDDTLELSGRTRFVYNGSGKMTERYDDSWVDSSGTWTESSKAELLYDLAGNNISYTQYYWYEGAWDPSHRTQMTYDEQGRMTLDVYSYWNGSEWLNTSKQEMIYSDGPDADEVIRYYWDGSGSTWVASQKDINTYDAKGNLVISINHIWDSDWIEYYKSETVFDTSYSNADLILPNWLHGGPEAQEKSMRLYDYQYSKREDAWLKVWETDYVYSEVTVSGTRPLTAPFRIYPNPAQLDMYVNPGNNMNYSLELFNIAGKRITFRNGNGTLRISLESLPHGVYFVRLSQHGRVPMTQRIVLK